LFIWVKPHIIVKSPLLESYHKLISAELFPEFKHDITVCFVYYTKPGQLLTAEDKNSRITFSEELLKMINTRMDHLKGFSECSKFISLLKLLHTRSVDTLTHSTFAKKKPLSFKGITAKCLFMLEKIHKRVNSTLKVTYQNR